jgi:TolA-binding protein
MTSPSCPRLFEVEAARDGRLAGAELASFERHMRACPACLREAQALEAPGAALRAGSVGKRDELHVRRERTRLLASFDGELVVAGRRWARWLLWPVPVAVVVVGLLIIFWHVRPVEPARASSAVVRASSAAVWSEKRQDHLDQIRLERGSLWLHIDHSSRQSRRLLVILPDGELEDTGTTFSVSAEDGRTTRVEVQDGSVMLRLRGLLPVAIGAGGTWSPGPAPVASASPASSVEPTPQHRAAPLSPSSPSLARPSSSPSPSASEPLVSSATPDPSDDFRAAMATLNAGDNAGAAAAFMSFLAKHPRDPRSEDAAYLRVIALRRSGDDGSMKQAGADYLRRYPAGFRHAEVELLLR